jgi:hypothetical protein
MQTKTKYIAIVALAGIVLAGSIAQGQNSIEGTARNAAKIRKGFAISPVALNLTGKNPDLVGLGSYLVNTGGCNDCHSSSNQATYAGGGSPFFGQPKKVNPVGFMGGGQDFGPFVTLTHLYTRNLTPDKSGLALGGASFTQFVDIMRNGTDNFKLHPNCSASVTTNCLPPPFDGSKLQIMPWPQFQDLDDYDLLAIYQYLSAIPCVAGPADKKDPLHHECN